MQDESLETKPIPPGWYDYPESGPGVKRYWDGQQWTGPPPKALSQSKSGGFPRPHWRKMTWVLIVWSVVMAIWIIGVVASAGSSSDCTTHAYKSACEAGSDAGAGIGAIVIWFIWFFGFLALSLIWFMSRPKGRDCPVCGEKVKRGRTACASCGHDFAAAAMLAPATELGQ
jgi:Protein of unknown function (DUF2510)